MLGQYTDILIFSFYFWDLWYVPAEKKGHSKPTFYISMTWTCMKLKYDNFKMKKKAE